MKKIAHSRTLILALALCSSSFAPAAVIGINPPAPAFNAERITALGGEQQAVWLAYLKRSQDQWQADQAALAAERRTVAAIPPPPASGNGERSMPLDQPDAWYGSAAARLVADNIVSFQTPAGGWGKNQPRDRPVRLAGQDYVANSLSKYLSPDDFDAAEKPGWSYVGTIDNGATHTEIRFLAKVAAQAAGTAQAGYRQSVIRGLQYLLAAEYPNGGWPQVWPLQGGYHNAITINDDAMVAVTELMSKAGRGVEEYAFVPAPLRAQALAAEKRAQAVLLAAQVRIQGRLTLWAQQYDPLTLAPVSARNYEPPALSSGESAAVLLYLMSLPNPAPAVVAAVDAGIATLRQLKIEGKAWTRVSPEAGRRLVSQPGAAPLWARYYAIDTQKPIFGDRDKTLHDDIDDISLERRNGYAWYGTGPTRALDAYVEWKSK